MIVESRKSLCTKVKVVRKVCTLMDIAKMDYFSKGNITFADKRQL